VNENHLPVEAFLARLSKDPGWPRKLLIGSLIGFIPVVNILCLGYLYRYVSQIRRTADCKLPEWNRWERLALNGLKTLAIVFLFAVVPWLAAWVLALLLLAVSLGLLGIIAWTPVALVLLAAPALTVSALYLYQGSGGNWESLFKLQLIARMAWAHALPLAIPTLLLIGFCTLTAPLWGLAFFAGPVIFSGYATMVLTRGIAQARAA